MKIYVDMDQLLDSITEDEHFPFGYFIECLIPYLNNEELERVVESLGAEVKDRIVGESN